MPLFKVMKVGYVIFYLKISTQAPLMFCLTWIHYAHSLSYLDNVIVGMEWEKQHFIVLQIRRYFWSQIVKAAVRTLVSRIFKFFYYSLHLFSNKVVGHVSSVDAQSGIKCETRKKIVTFIRGLTSVNSFVGSHGQRWTLILENLPICTLWWSYKNVRVDPEADKELTESGVDQSRVSHCHIELIIIDEFWPFKKRAHELLFTLLLSLLTSLIVSAWLSFYCAWNYRDFQTGACVNQSSVHFQGQLRSVVIENDFCSISCDRIWDARFY